MAERMKLEDLPVVRALPWAHRGRGVVVNCNKQVLGAFEAAADAEAVVAVVNALIYRGPQP